MASHDGIETQQIPLLQQNTLEASTESSQTKSHDVLPSLHQNMLAQPAVPLFVREENMFQSLSIPSRSAKHPTPHHCQPTRARPLSRHAEQR